MMRLWLLILIFAAHLGSPTAGTAYGVESTDAAAFRADLAAQLTQIVRDIDPSAQVMVTTTNLVQELPLPGTPFQLKDALVTNQSGELHFARVDITVIGELAELPAGLLPFLKSLVHGVADDVTISAKMLPDDVLALRRKQKEAALQAERSRPWEAPLADALSQMSGLGTKAERWSQAFPDLSTARLVVYTAAGLLASCLIFALGACALWLRSQRRALAALEQGFRQLASAYEAGGGSPLLHPAAGAEQLGRQALQGGALTSGVSPTLAALPDEGILALLSDCYWTNQDNYGAYVWRHIPVERKRALLKTLPLLDAYAAYIRQIPEVDLGYEQDPSYLNPLPIWHLDTAAVTALVRDNPALLQRLSPMRTASLQMRPTERLTLAAASSEGTLRDASQFINVSSTARALPRPLQIQIRSDEDEREVLALEQPPLSLISEVPSLGWLLKLPADEVSAILQPYSARDLASAWLGPKEVLDQLGTLVGDKKLELLNFQRSKLTPARSSPAFAALHAAAVAALTARADGGKAKDESDRHAA